MLVPFLSSSLFALEKRKEGGRRTRIMGLEAEIGCCRALGLRRRRQQQAWIAVIDTEREGRGPSPLSFLSSFLPPYLSFPHFSRFAEEEGKAQPIRLCCLSVIKVSFYVHLAYPNKFWISANGKRLFLNLRYSPNCWLGLWHYFSTLSVCSLGSCVRTRVGRTSSSFWWEEDEGERRERGGGRGTHQGLKVVSLSLAATTHHSPGLHVFFFFAAFCRSVCVYCVCAILYIYPTSSTDQAGKKAADTKTQQPFIPPPPSPRLVPE